MQGNGGRRRARPRGGVRAAGNWFPKPLSYLANWYLFGDEGSPETKKRGCAKKAQPRQDSRAD